MTAGPDHDAQRRLRACLNLAALLAAYAISMAIALRAPLFSGFNIALTERADGIIEISILEHWHRIFSGLASDWRQTLYFHPYKDTLGYNDGYLLFGLVYSGWRHWFDPFLADTLNIATWKTLGFFSSYCLVARVLRWERPVAILVACLLTLANGMLIRSGHAQLEAVALIPVAGSLAILLIRAEQAGRHGRASVLAAALALLLGLWLLTGFYLAWFSLYFTSIFVPVWLMLLGRRAPATVMLTVRMHWRTGAAFLGCFILATIPFIITYFTKLTETGGHKVGEVDLYLINPWDLINVGPGNHAWGWIVAGLEKSAGAIDQSWFSGEHETGFPVILFLLAMAGAWRVLRLQPQAFPLAFRAFALAIVISWLLTIRIAGDFSLWSLVYEIIPGARGLRVVLRYQIWLILPLLILTAGAWRDKFAQLARKQPVVAVAIAALLIAEQWTDLPPNAMDRRAQMAAIGGIQPIPAQCPAFYVVTARRTDDLTGLTPIQQRLYPHNVDAMLLAQLFGKPTINGFSTFNPPDWNFENADAPDYDARVARYARDHKLPSLCRLDVREAHHWRWIHYGPG